MTGIKRIVMATALLALAVPVAVSAQEALMGNRIAGIRVNCSTIMLNLQQTQRRDLVTRTNRGRAYEAVLKQMEAFQERVHNNKLASEPFDTAVNTFKNTANSFRSAYVRYDNRLIDLRQINCREKPEDFATVLGELRVLRAETAAAITAVDQTLADYRQAVVSLQQQLAPVQGGAQP